MSGCAPAFPTTGESNVDNIAVQILPLERSKLSSGSSSSFFLLQILPKAANIGNFDQKELRKESFCWPGVPKKN